MSSRSTQRHSLNFRWLMFSLAAIAPWLLLVVIDSGWRFDAARTPFFVVGLCSFFVSLPIFRRYKKALWAMQARDEAGEPNRWSVLASAQKAGLISACLPAWIAALGTLIGLEGIAGLLLVAASVVIACLYRIPIQVSLP